MSGLEPIRGSVRLGLCGIQVRKKGNQNNGPLEQWHGSEFYANYP